jgi:hypothetical protein
MRSIPRECLDRRPQFDGTGHHPKGVKEHDVRTGFSQQSQDVEVAAKAIIAHTKGLDDQRLATSHGELRDSEPMARLQISQSRRERGRGRISENRDQWALALDALSGKIPVAYGQHHHALVYPRFRRRPLRDVNKPADVRRELRRHAQCSRGADRDGGHAGERCFGSAQFS